jgi:hypothetical protein
MRQRLQYAIRNCKNIDGDTTHESMMNLNMAWTPDDDVDDGKRG